MGIRSMAAPHSQRSVDYLCVKRPTLMTDLVNRRADRPSDIQVWTLDNPAASVPRCAPEKLLRLLLVRTPALIII